MNSRRFTRKKPRPSSVSHPEVATYQFSLSDQFEVFQREGDVLFDHMIHNYESMVDREYFVKYFDIYSAFYGLETYIDNLSEKMDDIQIKLIQWIKKEYDDGKLFRREDWRPLRDPDMITSMLYLGYKYMFIHDHNYFQLAIVSNCEIVSFVLGFYGWKDESCEKLMPYKMFAASEEIHERFWNKK